MREDYFRREEEHNQTKVSKTPPCTLVLNVRNNNAQLDAQHANLSWSVMLKTIATTLESTDALVESTMADILSSETAGTSAQSMMLAPGDNHFPNS